MLHLCFFMQIALLIEKVIYSRIMAVSLIIMSIYIIISLVRSSRKEAYPAALDKTLLGRE